MHFVHPGARCSVRLSGLPDELFMFVIFYHDLSRPDTKDRQTLATTGEDNNIDTEKVAELRRFTKS